MFASGFHETLVSGSFSMAPAEILENVYVIVHNISANLAFPLSATQIDMIKE